MKISFYIVDIDNQPIAFANVYLSADKTIGTTSDENGHVVLENWQISSLTPITISYVGFKTITDLAGNINNKTILMEEDILVGAGVEVVGTKKKKICWLCLLLIGGATVYAATRENEKN